MDSDIIYVKTASGEEAMLQRTRVMQRNVRMVLILVDGQSTVADLCGKTGNAQLTENALRELEKGGFIEARVDRQSLWAESKKVAQEISSAAIEQISQFASPTAAKKAPPAPAPTPAAPPETPEVDDRVFVHSVFPALPRSDSAISQLSQLSQFSIAPMQALRLPAGELAPIDPSAREPLSTSRSAERLEPSFIERARSIVWRPRRRSEKEVSLKPIRRGPRASKGWPLPIVCLLAGLGLVYLALNFFPYDFYRPEVEAAFAQASGQSVKVGTMRIVGYPKPGLLLGNVRVGVGEEQIRVAQMRLQPVLGSLRSTKMAFSEVALSGVALPLGVVTGLPGIFAAAAASASPVSVEHLSFERTNVSFQGLVLSDLDGEAKLSADGSFESLLLRSSDRSLSLEARPERGRLNIALEGFAWRPSATSPFLFDSLNLQGNLDNGVLTISGLELRIFDGLIQGSAILRADKNPNMLGAVSFERINAARLGKALGIGEQISGEIAGKLRFAMSAASWATIFSAIDADGEFTVRRGNVRGIDLTEAVRRISRTPVQGGATIFERLSGKVRLAPAGYQFTGLLMNSGLMQSTGYVDVSQDLKVSGKMELQIRGTANQTRVPVSISGPLKTPSVQVIGGG